MSEGLVKPSDVLREIISTVIELVKEFPNGIPSGYVYNPLSHMGLSLDSYYKLITAMEKQGFIQIKNQQLHPGPKINDWS